MYDKDRIKFYLKVMKKSTGYKKLFEEIVSSEEYHRLEAFTEPPQWTALNEEEKFLLASLFVAQGEKELIEGEGHALESFRRANLLSPNNAQLMCRQALAFSTQSHNEYCLKTACKIFETVAEMVPEDFEVQHYWANTLLFLGTLTLKTEFLEESLTKFDEAEKLRQEAPAIFYRDKGMVWYTIGKISGEPVDFTKALALFQKAGNSGLSAPFFWNDYGNIVFELSQLLNRPTMIIEAVEHYWKSVKLSPTYFPGWFNLANSLLLLYSLNPQEAYYALGYESFEQASHLEPKKFEVWSMWGQLQALRGRNLEDLDVLKDSCKKFENADMHEPNHPIILSSWGEAIMQMASWTEDVQLLKEAQKKILQGLEAQRDLPRLWYLYGHNLNEFGKYYNDENYYIKAIEKFRYGLSLDSGDYLIMHGLSISLFALGQSREDLQLIQEAHQYCRKAVEGGGQRMAQFWLDWGLILIKLALLKEEKKYLVAAIKKIEKALSLRRSAGIKEVYDVEWFHHLGCAYEFLGDYEEDTASYEKAIQIQKHVIQLDPEMGLAYYNIATCYTRAGELTWNPDFFLEANRYFEICMQGDPEDDYACNEWGVALLHLAELVEDPAKPGICHKYAAQAESKLLQAASLGNTASFYYLACLNSMKENYDACFHYLEKCLEHQALPSRNEIMQDEWLENVRQTPQFTLFLSHLD